MNYENRILLKSTEGGARDVSYLVLLAIFPNFCNLDFAESHIEDFVQNYWNYIRFQM